MKISDQGSIERLPSHTNRTAPVAGAAKDQPPPLAGSQSSPGSPLSDALQLSSLAIGLQSTSAGDTIRAARLTQLAKAVQSNTFKVNPALVSKAIVLDALQMRAVNPA